MPHQMAEREKNHFYSKMSKSLLVVLYALGRPILDDLIFQYAIVFDRGSLQNWIHPHLEV